MNIDSLQSKDVIIILLAIVSVFIFSFLLRDGIFYELDYYEIKYTKKTKTRALWVIFLSTTHLIVWWQLLQQFLSRFRY